MPKLVTFIGINDYKETYYVLGEKKVHTRYFPVMAAELTRPKKIMVVKTKEATAKHWNSLREELINRNHTEPIPVDIPDGKSTIELWDIFNILVREIDEGDSMVFDITYSFRSLPLISFLSIAYLKFVKNVNIKALYYGAYEAKNDQNESPVFDLTGFCSLLDWIIGVNSFVKHGSAQEISALLADAQRKAKEEQGPARRELNRFGTIIENVSRALFTNRPFEVIAETGKLKYYTGYSEQRELLDRDVREWAVPFGLLIENIISKFSAFSETNDKSDPLNLVSHLDMVRWYVEHNYAPQALSMMRELIISYVISSNDQCIGVFQRDIRETIAHKLKSDRDTTIGKLWSQLSGLRNDVIHTGWSKESVRSSHKVMSETLECFAILKEIFNKEKGLSVPVTDLQQTGSTITMITPLGKSPGLLYTALHHVKPDQLLVITSDEVKKNYLDTILNKAGYTGEVCVVEVGDPFSGFNELSRIFNQAKEYIEGLPFHHLYVNLTGGTTLLQYFVTYVCQAHMDNRLDTITVAMIDRRSINEQHENPYVIGECVIVE